MELSNNLQLVCPIRGRLRVRKKSADGLTPAEEYYRDDISRKEIEQVILGLISGKSTIKSLTKTMLKEGRITYTDPDKRPSHIVLV